MNRYCDTGEQELSDLNRSTIRNADGPDRLLEHYGRELGSVNGMTVLFNDACEPELVNAIGKYDVVVGCVAWVSSESVLHALAQKKCVSIVLQKEDFLRPDFIGKEQLRELYSQCRGGTRYDFTDSLVGGLSYNGDPSFDPFRCVGVKNANDRINPLMHHKFLVFGRFARAGGKVSGYDSIFVPEAVWTGSMNMSRNANRSFENALFVEDTRLAHIYYQEWSQIMALSEPLDWEYEWVAPQWRIGT